MTAEPKTRPSPSPAVCIAGQRPGTTPQLDKTLDDKWQKKIWCLKIIQSTRDKGWRVNQCVKQRSNAKRKRNTSHFNLEKAFETMQFFYFY